MKIFCLIIFLGLQLGPEIAWAKFRQSEDKQVNQSRAQGTRGCPFLLGNIFLKTSSKDNLVVDSLTPVLQLDIIPPKAKPNQEVQVSLVEASSKNQVFLQTYQIVGESKLEVLPQLEPGRQYILTASLLCNRERPSTHKSLRVLVIPDVR
jgi:hypothetical protein